MPILNVEIVGDVSPREELAQRIADAAGEALKSRPRGTWTKVNFIAPSLYAENSGQRSEDLQPVFVVVIQANPPQGDKLQEQITSLTEAISRATGRTAENIHIIIEAPASGRIAFGGTLRT